MPRNNAEVVPRLLEFAYLTKRSAKTFSAHPGCFEQDFVQTDFGERKGAKISQSLFSPEKFLDLPLQRGWRFHLEIPCSLP
jgi:hypothetical protein